MSPIVPDINFGSNNHHEIYGGANPLENTQSVPIVNNSVPITPVQPEVNSVPTIVTPQNSQSSQNSSIATGVPTIQASVDSNVDTI